MQATLSCNVTIMKLLMSHGANVNAQDADGQTALIDAAMLPDRLEKVALLLKGGANPKLRDKKGEDALYYAEHYANSPTVRLLKRAIKNKSQPHFSPAM